MKKPTLIFVLLMVFVSIPMIKAQTGAGTFLLGISSGINLAGELYAGSDLMSLGFSTYKSKSKASGFAEPDPDKGISLNLIPKFGLFAIDNLAVGLDVLLAYNKSKDGEDQSKSSVTLMAAGPFVRYYFPAGNLFPFVEGSASFGSVKWKYDYEDFNEDDKYSVMAFGGGAGVALPLGDKVTLDIMAGYTSATIKAREDNPDDERSVMGTFGIKLGFVIFLGTK